MPAQRGKATWFALLVLGLSMLVLPALPTPAAHAAYTANPVYRINAGGGGAQPYGADSNFSGGTTFANSNTIVATDQFDPGPNAVYQSERRGVFSYTFGGYSGGTRFTVRLHFAEIVYSTANQRKFNVAVNGTGVLSDFDIFAYAGGANRPVVRSFNATANGSGNVVISFTAGSAGEPKVSAIELIPGFSYRVSAGSSAPVGEFGADAQFTGGSALTFASTVDRSAVDSPAPAAAYQSIRYGASFSYSFPDLAPSTKYGVRLHFAEVSPFTTTVGGRVFDVSINGTPILDNFDVLDAAWSATGPHDAAVVRQFFITSTSGGAISVGFAGVAGADAIVNAIEVAPARTFAIDAGGFGTAGCTGTGAVSCPAGWGPNTYIDQGADQVYTATPIDTSGVTNPAPQVVYQTDHYGTSGSPRFTYAFDGFMPGAIYRVRLHFVENYKAGPGQRVFNVAVNNGQPSGQPPELSLISYDIFARVGAHKAIVEELATFADPKGNIRIQFFAVADHPVVAAIEVVPEPDIAPGYHITDVGRLGTPSGIRVRDGKASARLGNGPSAKLLWTYGDTFLNGPAGSGATPTNSIDWTNSGSVSDFRRPQVSTELTNSTSPPTPATDKPRSQLIPYTTGEYNFTLNCHYSYDSWSTTVCPQATQNTRYIIWPSAAVHLPSGDVVVIGESNINLFPPNSCISNCPPVGVAAATVSAGTTPGSGTRVPNFVFTYCERRFSDGGVDDGTYAYLYRGGTEEQGDDCATGTGNYQWNKVGSTWSECGQVSPLPACAATYSRPLYNFSATTTTGTSTTDYATWQFVGNQVEFRATKQPNAGQVELSILDASNNVVWGPQAYNLYDPNYLGNKCIVGWTTSGPFTPPGDECDFTSPALGTSGTYRLKVRPTGVAGAGGGKTVTIDQAKSRDTIHPGLRQYVARAPLASVTNGAAYQVWNGNCSCWDSNKANATPMEGPTPGSYGPARGGEDVGYNAYLGKYVATSTQYPNNDMWLYTAPNPWGPWDAGRQIGRGANGTAIYSSGVHPELNLSNGQTLYVTYSRGLENFHGDVRILQIILPAA
jgi:Malectin domain/Domain of unknown function (DUF4185)